MQPTAQCCGRKFNLGQRLQKKGETLLECLGIPEDLAAERIVIPEEADRLIFYISALYEPDQLPNGKKSAYTEGSAPDFTRRDKQEQVTQPVLGSTFADL